MNLPIRRVVLSVGILVLFAVVGHAQAAVYWANSSNIGRINLDGSHPEPAFISVSWSSDIRSACGIAVDAGHVYWADSARGAIGRASLDGTNPSFTFITGAQDPCGIAVDSAHIYWANRGDEQDPNSGDIGRANLDGTAVDQSFVKEASRACGVAVDASHVYWASFGTDSIGRADLNGGNASQQFIEEVDGACGVAVNDSHIFWGTYLDTIGRARLDGTEPNTAFIVGLDRPCGIAVDGSRVFWTEEAPAAKGAVGTAALDGTAVSRTFVTGLRSPCGVAVDSLLYSPRVPPAPPLSQFFFRQVKHNRQSMTAFVAVDTVGGGALDVDVPSGVKLRVLRTGSSFTEGRCWVKIWPNGKSLPGRRLRERIRQRGSARVAISAHYTAVGSSLTEKRKRLSLIG